MKKSRKYVHETSSLTTPQPHLAKNGAFDKNDVSEFVQVSSKQKKTDLSKNFEFKFIFILSPFKGYKNEAVLRGIPTNLNYSFSVIVYDEALDLWSLESENYYFIGRPLSKKNTIIKKYLLSKKNSKLF